jgi:hypothetical protein
MVVVDDQAHERSQPLWVTRTMPATPFEYSRRRGFHTVAMRYARAARANPASLLLSNPNIRYSGQKSKFGAAVSVHCRRHERRSLARSLGVRASNSSCHRVGDFDLPARSQQTRFRSPAGTPNVDVAGVPASHSSNHPVRILMSRPSFRGPFRLHCLNARRCVRQSRGWRRRAVPAAVGWGF